MVRFSLNGIIACLLCVGILAMCMNTPEQSRLNADDVAQKKAEIEKADELAKQLVNAMQQQSTLNEKFVNSDSRTMDLVESLQQSIKMLGEHMRESVPTRDEVSKLVSAKFDASTSDGECTCGEKLADLQKQIDDLKSKVATLEQQSSAKTSTKASSAAAASSYGSVSSPVVLSSGGSTGSVKSGGSTGTAAVRSASSGGSTGSLPYGYSYHTDPATGILMKCYRDPMEALYSSTPVSSTVRYSAGQSSPGHWTYPGSIDSHLQSDHGVSVSGLSRSQMLNLHDSIHEGTATASTVITSAPMQVASPTSNCPNGQCPTSRSTSVNQTFFPRLRNRFGN